MDIDVGKSYEMKHVKAQINEHAISEAREYHRNSHNDNENV